MFSLWLPICVPLQRSLLARRGSLLAIHVVQHPTLRHVLHMEAFCAVGMGASTLDRYALIKGTPEHRAQQRDRAAARLCDTGIDSVHNTSLTSLLTFSTAGGHSQRCACARSPWLRHGCTGKWRRRVSWPSDLRRTWLQGVFASCTLSNDLHADDDDCFYYFQK